jgi:hypothetical protein
MEACRIGIHHIGGDAVDVGAPMKHKPLCYEILSEALFVMQGTPDSAFTPGVNSISLVMDMTGRVDVAAPLPPRETAYLWLDKAKDVIERFNDDSAPEMRPFNASVMGVS